MKNNILIYISIIFIIILSIYFNYNNIINYIIDRYSTKADTVFVTDTIRHVDTLTIFKEKPIPKEVILTKIDTFFTPKGDSILLKTENKVYQDSLCVQNDTAIVTNYISGINANLDSTKVQLRVTKETITNTVEITKYIEKKKTFWNRLSFGPAVTAGYDPVNKQWGVLIGGSVTFDIK